MFCNALFFSVLKAGDRNWFSWHNFFNGYGAMNN